MVYWLRTWCEEPSALSFIYSDLALRVSYEDEALVSVDGVAKKESNRVAHLHLAMLARGSLVLPHGALELLDSRRRSGALASGVSLDMTMVAIDQAQSQPKKMTSKHSPRVRSQWRAGLFRDDAS